ncbi:hypothetical protein JOC73_001564 [Alkaliphilus hydrothermalis]|uniref:Transposase IS66 central domain-containing protein n=1 Tax=Alkaliphilus hydrothermalis TaxID=1482730 RepID=A0ABS2NQC6_9FIRM|nr:hypothetical protein [Alkaliphilus hydrothermalis]
MKTQGEEKAKDTLAYEALKQIAAIYKLDNELSKCNMEDRVRQRKLIVKPQVEAFFAWVKSHQHEVPPKSETGKGFTYCLNQERYLKVFLEHGDVPLDNNATESAMLCNWVGFNIIIG